MSSIRVVAANEQRAEMQVAGAYVTFGLNQNGEAIDIVQMPPPHECYVPSNIMEQARTLAKTVIINCRERKAAQAKQSRLF